MRQFSRRAWEYLVAATALPKPSQLPRCEAGLSCRKTDGTDPEFLPQKSGSSPRAGTARFRGAALYSSPPFCHSRVLAWRPAPRPDPGSLVRSRFVTGNRRSRRRSRPARRAAPVSRLWLADWTAPQRSFGKLKGVTNSESPGQECPGINTAEDHTVRRKWRNSGYPVRHVEGCHRLRVARTRMPGNHYG
jgi:hypothetical protein